MQAKSNPCMSKSLTKSQGTSLRLKKLTNYNSRITTCWSKLLSHPKASTCNTQCKKKKWLKAKLRYPCLRKSMLSSRESSFWRFRSSNLRTLFSRAKSRNSTKSWTTIKRLTVSNRQSMRLLKRSIKSSSPSERSGTYSRRPRSRNMSRRSHSLSLTTRSKYQCLSLNMRPECLSLSQSRKMELKERSS